MGNLTTKAQTSNFDTESVVITRKGAIVNGAFPETTIYSGVCDFQSERGTPFYNPSGVVEVSDGVLYLDSIVNVDVGDKATVTQNTVATDYTVVNVSIYTFPLSRTEVTLKRGPLTYKGRR